jgi:hypothetical protein
MSNWSRSERARRRGGVDRGRAGSRVAEVVAIRERLVIRVGRAWINGREIGERDRRYVELERSHD